jgi:hypothetical protein
MFIVAMVVTMMCCHHRDEKDRQEGENERLQAADENF